MKSIRSTTTVLTVTGIVVIMVVGQLILDNVLSSWLAERFDDALHAKAQALVTLTKSNGVQVQMDFADEFMPEFSRPDNPEYFELYLQSGVLLERSRSFEPMHIVNFSDPAEDTTFADITLPDGRPGRKVAVRFTPQIEDKSLRPKYPEESREKAIIELSRERKSLDDLLFKFHLLIGGIGFLVVLIITFVVTKSIKSGLTPLDKIANDISRITPESMNVPIDIENQPDELKTIATQFNLVLAAIEKALSRERQFSSDVAHELRTPVSEMLALSEVGMRWPDVKEAASYFTDIHESSRHLDRLISNLLHLSRCEEGQIDIQISEVKLDSLLENICSKLTFEANAKNIDYRFPDKKTPKLLVDENWLGLILLNLLTNAIAHSPANSQIEVEFFSQKDRGSIQIKNTTIDTLSADDLDHIFERFWRKDLARTSGQHIGIGLALVKSYATCLGLSVVASTAEDGKFCIRISKIKLVY